MKENYQQQQWDELCRRLQACAEHLGRQLGQLDQFQKQASDFSEQAPPERYPDLLQRVARAADLAATWRTARDQEAIQAVPDRVDADQPHDPSAEETAVSEAMVDETLDESFPASDPPAWTHSHA